MSTTLTNGKPRKQLADQLDRLDQQLERHDTILDALSEGLNEAVADASKEGTRLAVKEAVIELLTDPELRAALHRASAAPAGEGPSAWERLKGKARTAARKIAAAAKAARTALVGKIESAKSVVAGAATPVWIAWQLRKVALVGLGVGLVVAAICYAASHGVAAAVSGAGAAVTTVAIQGGHWVRKTVRRLAMV